MRPPVHDRPLRHLVAKAIVCMVVILLLVWGMLGIGERPFGGNHPAQPADCVIRDSAPTTPYCP